MAQLKIQRSQARIGSSGLNTINRSAGEIVAGAASKTANALNDALLRKKDRDEKTKITAIENDIRSQSMQNLADWSVNRLEQSAEGSAKEYADTMAKQVQERIADISPDYQGIASERLGNIITGYSPKFAAHEAQQLSIYRSNVNRSSAELTKTETIETVTAGGNGDDLAEGVKKLTEFTMAAAGSKVEAGKIETQQQSISLVKKAIQEKAAVDPRGARDLMKDERFKDFIEDRAALNEVIDKKEVEIDSRTVTDYLVASDLSYKDRLKFAKENVENRETREAVISNLNFHEAQDKREKTETQFDVMSEMYDKIFVQGDKSVDVSFVRTSDSLSTLTFKQRMTIESWLGDEKAGQFTDGGRAAAWISATDKILSGEWTAADVKANYGVAFDIRDTKALISYSEKEASSADSLQQVSEAMKALYPSTYDNETKRAKTFRGVMLDIEQFKEINKRSPNRKEMEEMLNDRAEGFVTSSWYSPDTDYVDSLQAQYENIDEPGLKFISAEDMKKYPDYAERQTLRYRKAGFPDAQYLKSLDTFIIGEPAKSVGKFKRGTFYQMVSGVMYELPVDSEQVKQLRGE